jgi:hypothetical protein
MLEVFDRDWVASGPADEAEADAAASGVAHKTDAAGSATNTDAAMSRSC